VMRVRSREIFHEKVMAEVGMKAGRSTWGVGYQSKQWTNGSVIRIWKPDSSINAKPEGIQRRVRVTGRPAFRRASINEVNISSVSLLPG
jgi:hypothetical protein